MSKYLARLSMTREGVQALQKDKASSRRALAARLAKSAGGKLEAYYFAFGEDDIVAIVDLPDNVAAASISVAANAAGFMRGTFTPLLTVEEMDKAVAKSTTLRMPGR